MAAPVETGGVCVCVCSRLVALRACVRARAPVHPWRNARACLRAQQAASVCIRMARPSRSCVRFTCLPAQAVSALSAERRWCVTGTPVQNSLSDLFSVRQSITQHARTQHATHARTKETYTSARACAQPLARGYRAGASTPSRFLVHSQERSGDPDVVRAMLRVACCVLHAIIGRKGAWCIAYGLRCSCCTFCTSSRGPSTPSGARRSSAPSKRRSPLPRLRRDWAHRCHICTGTWPAAATSAPGLGKCAGRDVRTRMHR